LNTTPGGNPQGPLRWHKHQSAHFVFWFTSGSRAEKNVMALASRLETVRNATVKALNLEDLSRERVQIYLSDVPGGRRAEGRRGDGRGYETGSGQALTVYLSDAPGEAAEFAYMEMLLASSLGIDADRSTMLVDGVLGHVGRQTGASDPDEADAALAGLQSKGELIGLAECLRGPSKSTGPLCHRIVASFFSFLLTTYGAEPFKRFAGEFDPGAPDRAAQAAYGKPTVALEREWLAKLQQEQPGPEQQPSARGVAMGFFRSALGYLRPYWAQEALILLAAVVGVAFTIALPLAFGRVIDALKAQHYGSIWPIVIVVVVLAVLQIPALLGESYLSARVGARVSNDIQYKMVEHLQRLSTGFYFRTRQGEITSRFTNDLGLLNVALTQVIPIIVRLAITFAASLVTLFFLQGLLALVVLLLLPVVLILPVRFGARAASATNEMQQDRAMVTSTVQENIGAQQVIKAYSLQGLTLARFRAQLDRLGHSMTRGGFLSGLPGTTANLSVVLIQVSALAGGAIAVIYGAMGVGALVSFQLLLNGVTTPLVSIAGVWQIILQASVGMQRIEELLDEPPEIVDAPEAEALGPFEQEFRFENVNFSYTGEQVNLEGVNVTIRAGQSVAFVGPSGSGKSTILNLIMRFYDPTAGAVTTDGKDLRRVTQESLRNRIGTVFQETFLYNATVRENITLGKLDATDEQVEAAAKAAEIHEFVLSMPHGYDSVVGERGGQLSGGQRQRIALARAILYNPAILVLDEPTSALDPQTEAAVNATLHEQGKERTVATVTHRLASVVNADRIFVLERGRVVEQGSHEELLGARGLYYRLWGQQNGFEDAQRIGVEASRLRAIPFFENLDEALLPTLAERFSKEHGDEGQTIFREGDPGDKMYFVDRGEVEVVITDPAGGERRVAVLRDGDYFGEIALLENVPRTATVRFRTPTSLLGLDRGRFLDLLEAVPDLRAAFERGVEARRRANLGDSRETAHTGE
jgi:ATP-binding cassette, subfamily B, bacterial